MLVNFVIEDDVHLNIIRKIISDILPQITIGKILGRRGNTYIRSNLRSFNEAARFTPFIVLTDLDMIDCVPKLLEEWISFNKSQNLFFNVAIREAEAWLIADRRGFANYLGVSASSVERNVEDIIDPKQYIVSMARRSRKRYIREGIIPAGTAKVGKLYNSILEKFIQEEWNIQEAKANSISLTRFITKLQNCVQQ